MQIWGVVCTQKRVLVVTVVQYTVAYRLLLQRSLCTLPVSDNHYSKLLAHYRVKYENVDTLLLSSYESCVPHSSLMIAVITSNVRVQAVRRLLQLCMIFNTVQHAHC
jgi:hypothetical protein